MKRVAIIGGGITGLTTAYRLSQKGFEVTMFESSNQLGGLASGFKLHGNNLEKTYHHIFRTDREVIKLVEELNLGDKLHWYPSSIAIYYNKKIYPFTSAFDLLKFSPLPFIDRIRNGLVTLYLQLQTKWKSFVKVSAYDWLIKKAGRKSVQVIWEPLLKGKFDKYYKEISFAWLWSRIHIRAKSRQTPLSKEKLGYFEGGFNILVDAIEKKLRDNNVNIVLNAEVKECRKIGNKILVGYNDIEEEFDKVVCTVPSHVYTKLVKNNSEITSEYLDKLNSINYIGAVVMVFSSKQKLGDFYWYNINDRDLPFLVFINHTNLIDKSNYGNNYVYYLGSYIPHDHKYFEMQSEEIYGLWFENLKKIFPNFNEKSIVTKDLFKFKNAQHIVDLEYENKVPSYQSPVAGIYLANFSQIFPEDRGVNFAIREGNKVAIIIENEKLIVKNF